MNDFKMNPPGVSERIQTFDYLTHADQEGTVVYTFQEPSRFQKDSDVQVKSSKYNKSAKGLLL